MIGLLLRRRLMMAKEGTPGPSYVVFADPAVEAVVLDKTTHADPNNITEEEALLVTSIGTWFNSNTDIVSFDELGKFGVTSLELNAFKGCSSLVSIDISKIGSIGNSCFQDCSSLTSIKTNDIITTIPSNCFRGCSSLELIDFGSSVVTLSSTPLLQATTKLKKIVFRSTIPPSYEYTFKVKGAKLYVPDDAFSTYQASEWATTAGYGAVADSYGTQMLPLSEYVEE